MQFTKPENSEKLLYEVGAGSAFCSFGFHSVSIKVRLSPENFVPPSNLKVEEMFSLRLFFGSYAEGAGVATPVILNRSLALLKAFIGWACITEVAGCLPAKLTEAK